MGFRFRQSVRLLPGVRINFGKRGISATVGVRGAGVTVGAHGTYLNLGLPGTGVSYRTRLDAPPPYPHGRPAETTLADPSEAQPDVPKPQPPSNFVLPAQVIEFKSVDVASLGSESLARVSALLDKLKRQRATLSGEIIGANKDVARAKKMATRLAWLRQRIAPAALAARREYAEDCSNRLDVLKDIKESLTLNVEFNISDEAKKRFADVVAAFDSVSRCTRIWDITSAQSVDQVRTRSAASQSLDMRPVSFNRSHDDIMATEFNPPLFVNDNGADLFLYPAFIAAQVVGRFALLDIREVEITTELVRFIVNDGNVPSDAQVIGNTWQYVNKNGQPDRRFNDNPTIPVARYCKIFFRGAGLNEAWMVSNAQAGFAFGEAILKYKASLAGAGTEAEGIAPPSADEWPDVELPEQAPLPARDWKTPLVFYGGITAAATVIVAVAGALNPQLVQSSISAVEKLSASHPVTAVSPAPSARNAAPPTKVASAQPSLTSAEVAEIQQLLLKSGFDPGPVDGKVGARTRGALADWAKSRGIRDPNLDKATLEALRRSGGGVR